MKDHNSKVFILMLRFGSLEKTCYFHSFMKTPINTDHELYFKCTLNCKRTVLNYF